jgi:hypothetical protein
MNRLAARAAAACLLLPITAKAGVQNDVPSCYQASHITPQNGTYAKLFYVLIDQTVDWNRDLESAIMDNLNRNLTPGTKFVIADFSAFAQGRYLDVLHTGIIESPLPASQIGNTPIQSAKLLNDCLADQRPFAVNMADQAAISALQGSTGSLNNSDIMSALRTVSAAIAADPAPQKLLLLASDALENSAVASFYVHGAIRNIDPARELERAEAAGMLGNFAGARIYVIGAALPPPGTDAYESPITLQHLADFWSGYFQKSDATLIDFGEPALLQPVAFDGP